MVGHLRAVKDPFLTAEAARLAPRTSRLRVVHVGQALEPEMHARAQSEAAQNPRYRWLGPMSRRDTLRTIASSHVLVVTSRLEGGANVVAEAVMASTPVLSTRIDGTVGMLGPLYPGYFPVGDAHALAALLARAEEDRPFLRSLEEACRARRPAFEPSRERAAWAKLLAEL